MALFRKERTEIQKREQIEQMLVDEFARQGVTGQLVHDPDDPLNTQLRTATGMFGFGNVLLVTLARPEKAWGQLVHDHVRRMTQHQETPDLHDPATHRMLRARILPDAVDPRIEVSYAVPFAPGLIEILCLDLPETVTTVNDQALAGLDAVALRAIGRANLALEQVTRSDVGNDILLFEGESFFVASQLVEPRFVATHLGSAPLGFVAAIPDRHTLLVHVMTGPNSLTAINYLAGLLSTVDRDRRPGGFLSPYLYFLRDGGVQQITETGPDGETRVLADGAFLEAINGAA